MSRWWQQALWTFDTPEPRRPGLPTCPFTAELPEPFPDVRGLFYQDRMEPAFPPETEWTTFGDLVQRRQALQFGCLRCVGASRAISPQEAAARFGYEMRISEIRSAFKARCRSKDCQLDFRASSKWEPYRVVR